MSSLFSLFILLSAILLNEDRIRNKIIRKVSTINFISIKENRENNNNKFLNLINNKNILLRSLLTFILESSSVHHLYFIIKLIY